MSIIAVLPIKGFAHAKQRLAGELDAGPRRALAEAMCADVLVALRRAKLVDEILVVSGDPNAQQLGATNGASVVVDDREGHNVAASLGVARAVELGATRALLVPGDCPLLDPAELDGLLSREVESPSALIVPDRHGTGTNALLLTPPDSLTPAFGPDSCPRHIANAELAGTHPEVVDVPSLALDIDTPEDLEALQDKLDVIHGGSAHTRGMLRQLMRSRS
jgi:2-phospho-L-lactate/phosphoenolpyruvate guanylyltransferase